MSQICSGLRMTIFRLLQCDTPSLYLHKFRIVTDKISLFIAFHNLDLKFGKLLENVFWTPPLTINFVHGSYMYMTH